MITLSVEIENGGFSIFAGVFYPGNGRIGPALLKRPTSLFARRIQRRMPLLQERIHIFFLSDTPPHNQFRKLLYPKSRQFFRMKQRCII